MFRGAFKYRRCIIPASGFYEWTGAKGAKTPHYFTARDGRPLALAGIWDHWSGLDGGDDLPNATIIVGEANNWMRRFHGRMAVILDWRDAGAWMTGESPGALLRPAPDDALQEWIVSTREQGRRWRRRPGTYRADTKCLSRAPALQASN